MRSHHRDFGQLLGGGVVVDVCVDQEHLSIWQQQTIHAGEGVDAGALADHLVDVWQVGGIGAPSTANQSVYIALVQQHGTNQ